MPTSTAARIFFAGTALTVFAGLIVQLIVTAGIENGQFPELGPRLFNLFCYFTIQSNVIVAITTLLLALNLNRPSTAFRVFRLTGLIAITITGIVFHVALKQLQDLSGSAAFADFLLHTASPVLCVAGWLIFGPRRMIGARVAGLAFVFPLAWAIFTLIRGPIVDYYPYPFIDVTAHGYLRVVVTIIGVGVLFLVLAVAAGALDRTLDRRRVG